MKKIVLAMISALYASVAVAEDDNAEECYSNYDQFNYQQASKSCTAAADQGDVVAQLHLGTMYSYGKGVEQNDAEAFRWYRAAAEQGDVEGQYMIAHMYRVGRGVLQDYSQSVRWYRSGARQGYARTQSSLGSMHELGLGVEKNYVLAHMWYNIASANSNGEYGTEARNDLAAKMSSEQIAEAQSRAQQCMASNYTDC